MGWVGGWVGWGIECLEWRRGWRGDAVGKVCDLIFVEGLRWWVVGRRFGVAVLRLGGDVEKAPAKPRRGLT